MTLREATVTPLTPAILGPVHTAIADPFEREAITYRVTQLPGPNIAMWWQGELLGVGGLQLHHAGVAEPWLVFTDAGRAHLVPLYRAIVRWLREQIAALALHRMQGIARYDNDGSMRLLEHLGFTYEGTCRQFGPDRSDFHWYAWVRPWEKE